MKAPGMIRNLRELYQYRSLLSALTQRELTARYRSSSLGFLWTFLNPTLLMLVYAFVFSVLMHTTVKHFPYFIFIGLLPWIWFTTSVGAGASTISDRRDLLTKVRFPAQVLPSTVVLSNLINYILSLPLMIGLGLAFGDLPSWHVVFFPLIVGVQLIFTLALSYIISALNVAFRDLQHIVNNILTLGYFLTPVLYQIRQIPERYRPFLFWGNPMAVIMDSYQAIFYEHVVPPLKALSVMGVFSVVLLWLAARLFESRREEFAELV